MGGEDDDGEIGLLGEYLSENVEAALLTEKQIEQDRVKLILFQPQQAQLRGGGRFGVMAVTVDEKTGGIAESFIVIDNQKIHRYLGCGFGSWQAEDEGGSVAEGAFAA